MPAVAAGVLPPDVTPTLPAPGVFLSLAEWPDIVGDNVVKGWWKLVDQVRGVPGTYGKGYEGVRIGNPAPAGVGGTLPRIVLPDSVDSVEAVVIADPCEDTVDSGLGDSSASFSGDGRCLLDP